MIGGGHHRAGEADVCPHLPVVAAEGGLFGQCRAAAAAMFPRIGVAGLAAAFALAAHNSCRHGCQIRGASFV
jgi:hypothetical protein